MSNLLQLLARPWPWYVAGPLIGLMVPTLLLIGNKPFGVSGSLRHVCAAVLPARVEFFRYEWRRTGLWSLALAAGLVLGGLIAGHWLASAPVAISAATKAQLAALGIRDFAGLAPGDVFNWASLLTLRGFAMVVGGGFLVGFGTAYAGGCTSGHGITGLADLQLPSLVAVLGFFGGGLLATWLVLPALL